MGSTSLNTLPALFLANACRPYSGIFGYINYLVEKDRAYIIQTLLNGKISAVLEQGVFKDAWVAHRFDFCVQACLDLNIAVMTPPVLLLTETRKMKSWRLKRLGKWLSCEN